MTHQPPGSRYRRLDLHVHTPRSFDYKDKAATGADIVAAAIAAQLDAIAVTDHNDYRFVDEVQRAAEDTDLVVFPGVELSTRDGHLLGILDVHASGDTVRDVLTACGLRRESDYGSKEALCTGSIEDVAKNVMEFGGVAIAAHVDGPKGFWGRISKLGEAGLM